MNHWDLFWVASAFLLFVLPMAVYASVKAFMKGKQNADIEHWMNINRLVEEKKIPKVDMTQEQQYKNSSFPFSNN